MRHEPVHGYFPHARTALLCRHLYLPTAEGDHGYEAMAARMVELGSKQDGFLGIDSVRGADGIGITVSYWRDEASILAWKNDAGRERAPRGGQE